MEHSLKHSLEHSRKIEPVTISLVAGGAAILMGMDLAERSPAGRPGQEAPG